MMSSHRPKVSVVTTVLNARAFIEDAVASVEAQTYPDIEHVVKDAGSTDGTLDVIARHEEKGMIRLVPGKDSGIYDGMNQGVRAATGEIIAILNADDRYASPDAVAHMVAAMEASGAAVGWGDIVYVDRADPSRVVRRWKSSPYAPGKFRRGWHPPHPAFFVRREVYERYGYFRTDMRIAADYEFMLRVLEREHVSSCYLPEVVVMMRTGGASGGLLARLWRSRREDLRAWQVNKLSGGLLASLLKPLSKIAQFF